MSIEVRRIHIRSDADIVSARQQGRILAKEMGFSGSDQTAIATAISELARNIINYAYEGEIILDLVEDGRRQGLCVIAKDHGPGIQDIDKALLDGFSTSQGLGLGLPGTRRLMDEFDIVSQVGKGTTVTAKKWTP